MYDLNKTLGTDDFDRVKVTDVKTRKAMKLVKKYALQDEWAEALPPLLEIWKRVPDDKQVLTLLAHGLYRQGARAEAIGVLKYTLQNHSADPEICNIILKLSTEMEIYSVAEKIGSILIELAPGEPGYYIEYILVFIRQEKYDEAIDICQKILPIFPEESGLWNVLAIAVQYRDGNDKALVFYQEALRLNPANKQALNNIAMVVKTPAESRIYLDKGYDLFPEDPEINMGLATNKFLSGELEEGWEHYKYRFNPTRTQSQHVHYTHKLPVWQGEALKDKTLFATCEQGIGDEIIFSSILPKVYQEAKKLVIGVDQRLVSIFERSFPEAIVCSYIDQVSHGYRYRTFPFVQQLCDNDGLEIDFACPFGTIPSFYWSSPSDIVRPATGHLKADVELVNTFKERIQSITDKPLIGIAWTSGNRSKTRSSSYPEVNDLAPLFALKDKFDFLNLQYGDCKDDLDAFRVLYGVDVINFTDIDLKQDIEANLALMENCQIMISVTSAPSMFAMALGIPTVVITNNEPWWQFGKSGEVPFMKDGKVVSVMGNWEQTVKQAIEYIS
jgi:Flp pilus assembly protein TadD